MINTENITFIRISKKRTDKNADMYEKGVKCII